MKELSAAELSFEIGNPQCTGDGTETPKTAAGA